jgi:DNA-binding GntR family transcriptional regulator
MIEGGDMEKDASKKSLQQKAYELIKTRIINFEYSAGTFLSTLDLQSQMGISRTPIREALSRLEAEDLVKFFPNRGYTVSEISLSTISAVYETRIVIEPYIAANYGNLADVAELKRLRKIFERGLDIAEENPLAYMAYDDEFHALFRAVCPNIYLAQTLEQLSGQTRRVMIMSGYVRLKLTALCQEHIDIIDAMLEKNFRSAGKLMASHLTRARKNAFGLPSK